MGFFGNDFLLAHTGAHKIHVLFAFHMLFL